MTRKNILILFDLRFMLCGLYKSLLERERKAEVQTCPRETCPHEIEERDFIPVRYKIIGLVFLCFLLSACSPPKGLIGSWEADRQECLYKENEAFFKDSFTKQEKYILEFKEADQKVNLIYPDTDISANVFINQQQRRKKKTITCDVLFVGSYSYNSLSGSLHFNFADDETGAYEITKGAKCETDLQIKFSQELPAHSDYKKDPSVKVKQVGAKELRLAFPGFPKCKSEEMTFIFTRK